MTSPAARPAILNKNSHEEQKWIGGRDGFATDHHPLIASKTLLTHEEIQRAIAVVVAQIKKDYAGAGLSHTNPLVLVVVLKGSVLFAADLARALAAAHIPLRLEFVRCKSYESATTNSSQRVRLLLDTTVKSETQSELLSADPSTYNSAPPVVVDSTLKGRHVLVVEDIVDTANTLAFLLQYFGRTRGVASLRSIAVLDKPSRRVARHAELRADYTLCEIPNAFVVGYGLDFDEQYREFQSVCVLHPQHYESKL